MLIAAVAALQMVLKVTVPPELGLEDAAGQLDRSAVRSEAWHPGQDSFAQVSSFTFCALWLLQSLMLR